MISGRTTPKFLMAFFISAALHGAVSMAFFVEQPHSLTRVSRHFAQPQKSIMLELVPAPKYLKEEKKPEKASVLSDVASIAQNPDSKQNLPKAGPYQKGETEYSAIQRVLLPTGAGPVIPKQNSQSSAPHEKPKIRDLLNEPEEKSRPTPPPVEETNLEKPEKVLKADAELIVPSEIKREKNKIPPKKDKPVEPSFEKAAEPSIPQQKAVNAPGVPVKQDDFSSAAKKNLTTEAEIFDEIAYNSESNAVSKYLAPELKKVANVWQLKLFSLTDFSGGLFLDVRKTGIIFKIMPSGKVENLKVVEHDGNEMTERYPLEAVEKVAPFTPLPPEVISHIRTDGLWVKIEFNYTSKRKSKKQ